MFCFVRLFLGGKIETCSMGGSQSSCWPEGDQKRSDRGEKFFRYFSCRTSVIRFATMKPRFSLQVSTCWTTSVETLPQHEISLSKCWSTKGRPESCQAGSARVLPQARRRVRLDHPPRVNHPHKILGDFWSSPILQNFFCAENESLFCNECKGLYFSFMSL